MLVRNLFFTVFFSQSSLSGEFVLTNQVLVNAELEQANFFKIDIDCRKGPDWTETFRQVRPSTATW